MTVIVVVGISTVCLGFAGYRTYRPNDGLWGALYNAIALLLITFQESREVLPVPAVLQVARYLGALFVALSATAVGVAIFLHDRAIRWQMRRTSGHVVIVGATSESIAIASGYSDTGSTVVLVGDLRGSDVDRLAGKEVTVLPYLADERLLETVRGASRAILCTGDDTETSRIADVLAQSLDPDSTLVVLVIRSPIVAESLRLRHPALSSKVDVCCIPERVAAAAASSRTPVQQVAEAPPTVIVGDGADAQAVARVLVNGWSQPASPLHIQCIGPEGAEWVEPIAVEVGDRAVFHRLEGPWAGALVARQIERAVDSWEPSPKAVERGLVHGPLVFIAGLDDAEAIAIGSHVAAEIGDARLVMLVRTPRLGEFTRAMTSRSGTTALVVASQTVLADPEVIESTPIARLTEELTRFDELWSMDGHHLLPTCAVGRLEFVEALRDALPSGGLIARPGQRSVDLLLPDEISIISTQVQSQLTGDPEGTVELVRQLPQTLARIGISLYRSQNRDSLLPPAVIERMAAMAHARYLGIAQDSGNVTGSAFVRTAWQDLPEFQKESNRDQVRHIPAKLALAGYGLERGSADGPASFDDEIARRLAIYEHRRWAFVHRSAGYDTAAYGQGADHQSRTHPHLVPWDELTEEVQAYDYQPVRDIPELLRSVDLTMVRLDRALGDD